MNIILLGAPGSGKGTQGKILKEHFQATEVSLGDLLRIEVKQGSLIGKKVESFMKEGALVPDEIVAEVIKQHIPKGSFLLDGFPRTIAQAEILEKLLKEKGISIDLVLYFHVPENVLIERLSGRRVCKNCGRLYHMKTMPPKQNGLCDSCQGPLITRADDNEETIKKRLAVFLKQSLPLFDYYKKKNILLEINAEGNKDVIFSRILDSLKKTHGAH